MKFRHLLANMPKPTYKDRQDLEDKEAALQAGGVADPDPSGSRNPDPFLAEPDPGSEDFMKKKLSVTKIYNFCSLRP